MRSVEGPHGETIESRSIIVTKPNATLARVHDRMPVVLDPSDHELWLDRTVTDPVRLLPLLRPTPDDALSMRRVSTRVNNAKNDGPDLIEPLQAAIRSPTSGRARKRFSSACNATYSCATLCPGAR
jgi:putative SOS response-associated peptidase YedK